MSTFFRGNRTRLKHLSGTALNIWQIQGFSALVKRSFKFVKGERRYYRNGLSEYPAKQNCHLRHKNEEYQRWINENEPTPQMLDEQRRIGEDFPYLPLISILTPVFNTDQTMLEEMLESVLAQTYQNWELCLVDGGSVKTHIRPTLDKYAQSDSRIKIKYQSTNLGISGNSNEGLKMVGGEFIALLDHDDLLSADALFEIVSVLNRDPTLEFIYSDKDTITEDGKHRFNPLFKPQWSPDILFNTNYLTHLNVIQTRLLREIGGFDTETNGAQDWDIFLRVTNRTKRIAHVPRILYHWRYHEASTASGMQSKPYALEGQLKSIEKHLMQKGLAAKVETGEYGIPKVIWGKQNDLTVTIIIDFNHPKIDLSELTEKCFIQLPYSKIEVAVINRTKKRLALKAADSCRTQIKVFDFEPATPIGAAWSDIAEKTTGDVFLFLNANLRARSMESAIHELISWTQFEEIGVVGGLLLQPDGSVADTGIIFDEKGDALTFGMGLDVLEATLLGHLVWYRNFTAMSGECLAVKRKIIKEAGGFNKELDSGCGAELCLRIGSAGYRNFYTPYAVLKYKRNNFVPYNLKSSDLEILQKCHKKFFEHIDPFSNFHLGFDAVTSTLGFREILDTKSDE